jgi:imidazolonepropionase-like amidohydrolase
VIVFDNARIFDGWSAELIDGQRVIVEGDTIREISAAPAPATAERIDCNGRVLMPGMIDAHVHATFSGFGTTDRPPSYHAHYAARFLTHMLDCGFTTVRDVGGADIGLSSALKDGLLLGPRLFYGGRALSQSGGAGDPRSAHSEAGCCACAAHGDQIARVVDGVDQVRQAVREELRRGARHIKVMASGGVVSPDDPLDRAQYSDAEIAAGVEETTRWGAYVAAHCHPAAGIGRLARLGVRTIEHGTLIDEPNAKLVAEAGAFVVPTMAIIFALQERGDASELSPASRAKLTYVADRALEGLAIMRDAGVKMGFGTDLIGDTYRSQGTEFTHRAKVLPPIDILRSACSINADLLGETGRLGRIQPGAVADILVVNGDPLREIKLLAHPQGSGLWLVMQAGQIVTGGNSI